MRSGVSLVALAAAVSVSISGVATAQEAQPTEAVEPEAELSELELLSQNGDDPFAGVIEQQEREAVSVTLRALDKITARYIDIEIPMNEIARFGSLELLPRTCDKRPPEEFPETTVFLEIFDTEFGSRKSDLKEQEPEPVESDFDVTELRALPVEPVGALPEVEAEAPDASAIDPELAEQLQLVVGPEAEGVNIFRGWMFASSPALNPLEHPVYDVWVINCTTREVAN